MTQHSPYRIRMKMYYSPAILLLLATTYTCSLHLPLAAGENEVKPTKHRIDTHIHLYDTRRDVEITWPPESDEILYQPHLPNEYTPLAKSSGVTGVVVVEASLNYDDNRWVLDLVANEKDFYVGLVGNIDINEKEFRARLRERKKDSRFVGIRPRNREPIDYTDKVVLKNLRILAKNDLTMDYLTNGGGIAGLEAIEKVATEIPKLKIVVNHCLGYNFDGKSPSEDWIKAVNQLASHPNVSCKISGLYQRSTQQPAPQDITYYEDVLEVLWSAFGEDRLVYGSNWPVTKHTGSYQSFVQLVDQFISKKGSEAREKYYWKNATELYKLPLK